MALAWLRLLLSWLPVLKAVFKIKANGTASVQQVTSRGLVLKVRLYPQSCRIASNWWICRWSDRVCVFSRWIFFLRWICDVSSSAADHCLCVLLPPLPPTRTEVGLESPIMPPPLFILNLNGPQRATWGQLHPHAASLSLHPCSPSPLHLFTAAPPQAPPTCLACC